MKNIDLLFNQFTNNTPGCAVCVVQNRKVIYERCFGLTNLETKILIKPDTAFRLASLTKPFTALAIMILQEQREFDFGDPLDKFFPDFPTYGKGITIRQLLTHASGIPDHEAPLYKKIKPREEPTIYDSLKVLYERKRTLFKPGSKFRYSDAGYVVLALIIERVSGLTYSEFLKRYVFKPLKMNRTIVVDETKPEIPNRAIGYRKKNNQWEVYDYDQLNYIIGDEGIYSTIRDLAKWSSAWNTNMLVSKGIFREALSPFGLPNGKNGRCGFSWFIDIKRKIRFQDGFWVGFNNIMLTDINTNTTVIFLSNTTQFPTEKGRVNIALKILGEYHSCL